MEDDNAHCRFPNGRKRKVDAAAIVLRPARMKASSSGKPHAWNSPETMERRPLQHRRRDSALVTGECKSGEG